MKRFAARSGIHFALEEMEAAHLLLRAASADGHSANIRRWRMRLRSLPQRLRWMPRVLPDVLAAALAYRRAPLDGFCGPFA